MKILLILPVLVGAVWCVPPMPRPELPKEKITIFLTPSESKVIELDTLVSEGRDKTLPSGSGNQHPISTTTATTTTDAPVTDKSVPIDLSQRLFHANHLDSQFRRKTLDLSGLDLSGDDVMKILYSLNSTTLDSVARLDLSHNRVWSLPSRVWPLQLEYSLRELRLDHNQLDTDDPDSRKATSFELCRLASLKKLSVSHNGLADQVSVPALEFPRGVESLDLSGNRLFDLPMSLAALPGLRHLDVSGNRIRYLGAAPLASLEALETLNMSGNGLERTWNEPFEKLVRLETLRLDNNSLSELPRLYHFRGSYQPRMEVYISGNPLKCRCDYKDIMDVGRVIVMDDSNVTCVDSSGVVRSLNDTSLGRCSTPILSQARDKWSSAKEWVRDNRPDWSTLYRSLGWMFFGVTLAIVYAHRRSKKTPPPAQVPYNVLDDRPCY